MPQDSKKSAGYRSFLKCDDPKGVVDCGTIKKPKTDLQKMKNKIEVGHIRNPRNSNSSSSLKELRKEMATEESRGKFHSSLQLSEISRGAEKLNDAIDSLSKGLRFDSGPKEIAKDLLRGALDLQESLIALGKLQKASQYMSKSKNQKKKSQEKAGEEETEEMSSIQYRDSHYQMGFQKPRLSADGCSRNSYEELRKSIRDGLARQNLLMDSDTEDEAYFAPRKSDCAASELATTSSSRFCSNDFASAYYSLSSKARAPQKNATCPNVIGRLMGLEEMPSKPHHLRQRKPILNIDKKVEPDDRTVSDVFETEQVKGLLKNELVGGIKSESHYSNTSQSKQRLIDDVPPIVIMKPVNLRRPDSSELYAPTILGGEEYLAAKEVIKRLKLKKEFQVRGRVRAEGTPIKRVGQEEGTEECKEVIVTSEVKKVKPKQRTASGKTEASGPPSFNPEKKEVIDPKFGKIQKAASFGARKTVEENSKTVAPKIENQAYALSTKSRKPESGLTRTKNQPYEYQSAASTTQTISGNLSGQKKNRTGEEQADRKVKGANKACEKIECKDDARRIELPPETDSNLITIDITAEDLCTKEPTDAFEIKTDEHPNGVAAPNFRHDEDIKSVKEAMDIISRREIKRKGNCARASTKALLFSSPSFLNHAEDLFDLNMNQLITLQAYDIKEFAPRLSLDCAMEILGRKSLRDSQRFHPLLPTYTRKGLRTSLCLDQLVEEVCDGIEDLRSYGNLADGNLPSSRSLYSVVERDIRSKGVESGMWDFGWRNEFSMDDVELVVGDIDKLILSNLIEELL